MAYATGNKAIKTLNNVVIQLRNDTADNWGSSTYVLAQGELGLDRTNSVIKIGDGTHTFSELPNAGSVISAASAYDADTNPGGKDRTHGGIKVNGTDINVFTLEIADTTTIGAVLSQAVEASGEHAGYAHIGANYLPGYVTVADDGKMTVQVVAAAEKLYTARTIEFEESATNAGDTDVTGSFTFDGSADVATQLTLVDKNTLAAATDYYAVQVDNKGRVLTAKTSTEVIATDGASGKLGLVKSEYNDAQEANADDNKGKVAIDASGNMSVARVNEADKFHTARAIDINAGGTYATKNIVASAVNFDGSADISLNADLTDTGVIAGSYTRVTVDAKGRVNTAANDLVTTDIKDAIATTDKTATNAAKAIKTDATGELDDTFLKNVTTATNTVNTLTSIAGTIITDTKGRVTSVTSIDAVIDSAGTADAGKLVKLNSDGKLSNTIIPPLAIGEIQRVEYTDSETVDGSTVVTFKGITTAQSGDMVVVHTTKNASETQAAYETRRATNGDGVYVYASNTSGADAYNASNWILVSIPGSAIQSVNGYQGPTIVLDTDDVAEDATAVTDVAAGSAADATAGHNRYFTQARVKAYLGTLDARADEVFVNADRLVYDNDTIQISCGTASGATQGA